MRYTGYKYRSVLNDTNKFDEVICSDRASGHEIFNICFDVEKMTCAIEKLRGNHIMCYCKV